MKRLLNTLFVTQPDSYLSLEGNNIVIIRDNLKKHIPLHNLEAIITFGHTGASPALMGYCAEKNISITFLGSNGHFRARVIGKSKGNVILRKTQYRLSDNEKESVKIARNFIVGKVFNQKWMLERIIRDYPMRINKDQFKE